MQQQAALHRLAGGNHLQCTLEIKAGLRFTPGAVFAERLQMKQSLVAIERVAIVTTSTAGARFQKDWFDTRDKESKVE